MSAAPPRVLVLGAHPDDAEFHAGGLAAFMRGAGHEVKFVSVTDGGAGHHMLQPAELRAARKREAAAAGRVIGVEYEVWENPDGALLPTLEVRAQMIAEIRRFQPELVLTHRPCDYHPDHRAVAQAVQDACYMVTVPLVVPEVPALRRDPVVAYMVDTFTRPVSLRPDVLVDVGEQLEAIVSMLACHVSQVFQWLPYNARQEETLPESDDERRVWLRNWFLSRVRSRADLFRAELVDLYGAEHGNRVEACEALEVSEYAAPLDEEKRSRLFPFLS
jgi:LmbE family N-acetylglucosaminyl deacetylase